MSVRVYIFKQEKGVIVLNKLTLTLKLLILYFEYYYETKLNLIYYNVPKSDMNYLRK